MRTLRLAIAILLLTARTLTAGPTTQPIVIRLDPAAAGDRTPADFLGISIETSAILPDAEGKYRFSADDKPLVQMFKTLGVQSLRIGGTRRTIRRTRSPRPPRSTRVSASPTRRA